ncbi:MAG: ribosome small subunit-dependent GTPase A [Acidimicrobiia bacterium]
MGSDPRIALGWTDAIANGAAAVGADADQIARVIADSRGWVRVLGRGGERDVEVHRSMSATPDTAPVVGDWVVVVEREGMAPLIGEVLERSSQIIRPNRRLKRGQTLASNVDVAWILEAVDAPRSWVRVLRLATLVADGGVRPELVLTKSDCVPDAARLVSEAAEATLLPTWSTSVLAEASRAALHARVADARAHGVSTIALIGPSGSGKSSLVNFLVPAAELAVGETRSDGRGRHTTTSRALFRMEEGGCLVDTPGIRSVVIDDEIGGVDVTFPDIESLGEGCKFRDCSHDHEPACAVRAAIAEGALPAARLEAYLATLTRNG